MTQPQVIEGTPKEIQEQLKRLDANMRVTLIIPAESDPQERAPNLHYATPEERARALDEIAEMNRDLPGLGRGVPSRKPLRGTLLMAYLADTNIITRRVLPGDPKHAVVSAALLTLDQQGEAVFISPQNLIEFQALATRPLAANGLGMTPAQASAEARRIEAAYSLLPDIPVIYPLWRNLVDTYTVVGRQVYDARLVAVMQAHGVTHLLTLDQTDFRRYAGVIAIVEPQNVR